MHNRGYGRRRRKAAAIIVAINSMPFAVRAEVFKAAHDLATTSSNMGTAEPVLQSRGIDRLEADTGDSRCREGWIGSTGNRRRGNAIDGVGSDLQQHRLGTPARPRREPRSEALPSPRSHIFFSSFQ